MAGDEKSTKPVVHATAKDMSNGVRASNSRGRTYRAAPICDRAVTRAVREVTHAGTLCCPDLRVSEIEDRADLRKGAAGCMPHVITRSRERECQHRLVGNIQRCGRHRASSQLGGSGEDEGFDRGSQVGEEKARVR